VHLQHQLGRVAASPSPSRFPPRGLLWSLTMTVFLDKGRRLSTSRLWKLQQDFYERQGLAAFASGVVPSQITTSPRIAAAYARVVRGFLLDCGGHGGTPRRPLGKIHPGEPLYLFELGAGSGRLAHLFLNQLASLERTSPLAACPRLVYVMTDASESNVRGWAANPLLRAHVDAGRLVLAVHDASGQDLVRPYPSGKPLSARSVRNPIVLVANYLFDSLPQDVFRVRNGVLEEGRVTLSADIPERRSPRDPAVAGQVNIRFDYQRARTALYEKPAWNELLRSYTQQLEGSTFLMPIGALRCLERFASFARRRVLVLAADKGRFDLEALRGAQEPAIARHGGAFSFMVNFHALADHAARLGGFAMHSRQGSERLGVAALFLGGPAQTLPETRLAFERELSALDPLDCHTLVTFLAAQEDRSWLDLILATLELSGWDPACLVRIGPALRRNVHGLKPAQQRAVLAALERIRSNDFPLSDAEDLASEMALVLQEMGVRPASKPDDVLDRPASSGAGIPGLTLPPS